MVRAGLLLAPIAGGVRVEIPRRFWPLMRLRRQFPPSYPDVAGWTWIIPAHAPGVWPSGSPRRSRMNSRHRPAGRPGILGKTIGIGRAVMSDDPPRAVHYVGFYDDRYWNAFRI